MGIKIIEERKIEKMILKNTFKKHNRLIKWLYDNHKDILREWEATRGKVRIEFLNGELKNGK